MTTKAEIVARLGESAVLLPGLIAEALSANDRAKLRLTLLQAAAAQAAGEAGAAAEFGPERRAAGLDDPAFDHVVDGARDLGGGRLEIPGADPLLAGLEADLEAMIAPLAAAGADTAAFEARLKALGANAGPLTAAQVAAMASGRRDGPDSQHRLIMDLHKAINALAGQTAVETVDGARAHRLDDSQRRLLRAFMRGLNRTAPLAFGHPGLGTTAVGGERRLTIQNDIGQTDAHVIVIHVDGLSADVTYTDVHRRRAKFFVGLFDDLDGRWTALDERAAPGLEEAAFYLTTGRFLAADEAALDALLERLGSRLVFLIDWNKARKALQAFVGKAPAVRLLALAAREDVGHRAFLELGGGDLVIEVVRRVAAARAPYGQRLDEILGPQAAFDFLADVLRIASEGLSQGRSARLLRDEIEAGLAERLQSAECGVLDIALRHLGLSRMLAGAIRDAVSGDGMAPADARGATAALATRLERKGDSLTLAAREAVGRLAGAGPELRAVVDQVEAALDSLDEAAFLLSLAPAGEGGFGAPLQTLAETAVESASQMARACEAASRAPPGGREDSTAALQAIDAVRDAERAADAAERGMIAALMQARPTDPRAPVVGVELAHAIERATDEMAHAALALRDYLLGALAL